MADLANVKRPKGLISNLLMYHIKTLLGQSQTKEYQKEKLIKVGYDGKNITPLTSPSVLPKQFWWKDDWLLALH